MVAAATTKNTKKSTKEDPKRVQPLVGDATFTKVCRWKNTKLAPKWLQCFQRYTISMGLADKDFRSSRGGLTDDLLPMLDADESSHTS